MELSIWLTAAILSFAIAAPPPPTQTCGYESCPTADPAFLNVHIVPHTHDDVGWLKTVDQYYYGSRNDIQKAGVQYILDSVVDELWKDSKRRFIYVETAFFWKWWNHQHDSIRHKVHTLVREGRLEFIGGAWSMNDEAATHYRATIDQFTWGLRKLNDTFGECGRPRVGWQIDPFGHSREFASLLAAMGYDGLFHGRLDYQDKGQRLKNKSMEMLWRGNDDLGDQSDIFTGVLYNTYSPPAGFCFDVLCSDEPIIDDVKSPMYNVEQKVRSFLAFVNGQKVSYATNNVIVTMGGDFTYQHAHMWYHSLDRLITHTNVLAAKEKMNIKLFYSTPSCYLKALHDAAPRLPTKRDDFFPYASDQHSYWTGYFTSRPTVKYFERRGNAYLQMSNQLQVLANLEYHNHLLLDELRSAMGIMQHHDAVTGTEKQHVSNDYCRILDQAIEDGLVVVKQAISKVMELNPANVVRLDLVRCQLNISECNVSQSDEFVLVAYNPLPWKLTQHLRIPVNHSNFGVYDEHGEVPSQATELPSSLLSVPTRHSTAKYDVVWQAALPPMGYNTYYVRNKNRQRRTLKERFTSDYEQAEDSVAIDAMAPHMKHEAMEHLAAEYDSLDPTTEREVDLGSSNFMKADTEDKAFLERNAYNGAQDATDHHELTAFTGVMLGDAPSSVDTVRVYDDDDYIENQHMKVSIDKMTGQLKSLHLSDGTSIMLDIGLLYYEGCVGNNVIPANRSSGAYIFRPNGTAALPLTVRCGAKIIKGPVVQEIHHVYSDFASSVIRLYNDSRFLEFEWLVGPIPVDDKIGKEVVVRYSTNLSNNNVFYTDSNGKQSLERVFNKRPQYNLTVHEPIAGNYYPVNSKIHIEDAKENIRFSVMNDRAQGGSSLSEGQIELMVHRRLLHDDAFGVGEALNEVAEGSGLVARGKHFITLGKITPEFKKFEKKLAAQILQPIEILVSNTSVNPWDDMKWLKMEWSGLKKQLPEGLNLITLEQWRQNLLLLRLENIYEKVDFGKGETTELSVDLTKIFNDFTLTNIKEASLAANQWYNDRTKMKWDIKETFNEDLSVQGFTTEKTAGKTVVTRAKDDFIVTVQPSQIRTFFIEYSSKVNQK